MIRLGDFFICRDNPSPMTTLSSPLCHASDATAAESIGCRPPSVSRLIICGSCFAIAAILALSIDRTVALWFQDHRLPGELARLVRLAEIFGWGGGAALIILTATQLDPRRWRIALPLAIHSLGAGLAADTIKLFIARTRPLATDHSATVSDTFVGALPLLNTSAFIGGYGHHVQSFPSAHAATAVGLAIALSSFYPRGRWLFTIFAGLAMLQRLDAHAHYLSDVLAGAALAFFLAAIYARFNNYQQPGPNLVPKIT
ncbi:MAG TPA: phosphatase PAP2 family protein [Pirellulaceae bacterium]|jgi:membrane-associated phospholipid phosphatase